MDIGTRIKHLREEKKLTQEQLAKSINSTKQAIFKYENGVVTNIPMDKLMTIAKVLGCSPSYLMGWSESRSDYSQNNLYEYENISPVSTQRIPMLGNIACGEPIFADEERDCYVECGTEIKADFCLTAHGDSMIGARIHNGDIVFCKSQSMVDNGEIAAVIIGDDATLKRVFYYPEKKKLVLQAENPKYEPFVYVGAELEEIRIIGKAVTFQSNVK